MDFHELVLMVGILPFFVFASLGITKLERLQKLKEKSPLKQQIPSYFLFGSWNPAVLSSAGS